MSYKAKTVFLRRINFDPFPLFFCSISCNANNKDSPDGVCKNCHLIIHIVIRHDIYSLLESFSCVVSL